MKIPNLIITFVFGVFIFLTVQTQSIAQERGTITEGTQPYLLQSNIYNDFRSVILREIDRDGQDIIGSKKTFFQNDRYNQTDIIELEVLEDTRFPYIRLDISEINGDSQLVIENRETSQTWIVSLRQRNIFSLPVGSYYVNLKNIPEDVTVEIMGVEYPFIGRLGVLSPEVNYRLSDIEEYLSKGGYILAYSQPNLITDLGIESSYVEVKNVEQSLFNSDYQGQYIELLDVSNIQSITIVDASSSGIYDASLVELIPVGSGGVIYISESAFLLDKNEFANILNEISTLFEAENVTYLDIVGFLESSYNSSLVLLLFAMLVLIAVILPKPLETGPSIVLTQYERVKSNWNIQSYHRFVDWYKAFLIKILTLLILPISIVILVLVLNSLGTFPQSVLEKLQRLNIYLESVGIVNVTHILISLLGFIILLIVLPVLPLFIILVRQSDVVKSVMKGVKNFLKKYPQLEVVFSILIILLTTVSILILLLRFFGVGSGTQLETVKLSSIYEENESVFRYSEILDSKIRFEVTPKKNFTDSKVTYDITLGDNESEVYLKSSNGGVSYITPVTSSVSEGKRLYEIGQYDIYSDVAMNRVSTLSGLLNEIDSQKVGVARTTVRDGLLNAGVANDSISWGDLLVVDDQQFYEADSTIQNAVQSYNLNSLNGKTIFYTLLDDSLDLNLVYTDYNRELGLDGFMIVVLDNESKILHIEEVSDDLVPLGIVSSNRVSTINLSGLSRGLYQILVIPSRRCLTDVACTEIISKDIGLESISINSNKFVYRSFADTLTYYNDATQYLYNRDRKIPVGLSLGDDFITYTQLANRNLDVAESIITPIQIGDNLGYNSITPYFTLLTPDRVSFFNPFSVDIGSVLSNNTINVIRQNVIHFDRLLMTEPIRFELFTLDGSEFTVLGDIGITISED